jgi:2-oxoglutarate ferredoxin oxidoreductase subunit delta
VTCLAFGTFTFVNFYIEDTESSIIQKKGVSRKMLHPREEKKATKTRIVIIKDRCKGCGYCIEFCPVKALEYSNDINARGVHPPQVKKNNDCTGCGLCERLCPDFAIYLGKEEK